MLSPAEDKCAHSFALSTRLDSPEQMREEVRELARKNRRMERSIAEITAVKDRAEAEVAALYEEREALVAKVAQSKSYLRQRDFLQVATGLVSARFHQ